MSQFTFINNYFLCQFLMWSTIRRRDNSTGEFTWFHSSIPIHTEYTQAGFPIPTRDGVSFTNPTLELREVSIARASPLQTPQGGKTVTQSIKCLISGIGCVYTNILASVLRPSLIHVIIVCIYLCWGRKHEMYLTIFLLTP